jgi:hypothetical protein
MSKLTKLIKQAEQLLLNRSTSSQLTTEEMELCKKLGEAMKLVALVLTEDDHDLCDEDIKLVFVAEQEY